MPNPLATIIATLGAVVVLIAGWAAPTASAASPWWGVTTGSYPSNMWEAKDSVQVIQTEETPSLGAAIRLMAAEKPIGCLGTGVLGGLLCPYNTGFPATETAGQLEALLEAAFETSAVEVTGGPVGGDPFVVTVPGRSAPRLSVLTFFGKAQVETKSVGGSGRLVVTLNNLGTAAVDGGANPVTIVDKLPAGMEASEVEGRAGDFTQGENFGPVDCSLVSSAEVSCEFKGKLPPYQAIEVETSVSLTAPPAEAAPGSVSVSGGGAPPASTGHPVKVSPDPTPFGIEHFSARSEDEGGAPTTQAGAHPFQLTTTLQLKSGPMTPGAVGEPNRLEQPAMPRNLRFPLPAGLVGNTSELPQCPVATFLEGAQNDNENCSPETAVGVASILFTGGQFPTPVRVAAPVYNLVPSQGEPARFGFAVKFNPVIINTKVDPNDRYRINAEVRNTTQAIAFLSSTVTLWGTPGDPLHDSSRGWDCILDGIEDVGPCSHPVGISEVPLFRQPVACDGPLDFSVAAEPWHVPLGSLIEHGSNSTEGMHGCNKVPFDPSIAAAATSKLAENPSGLDFKLEMPNFGLRKKEAIAEGQAKKVEVALPEGMTINPSQGEGLAVCSPDEYRRERFDSAPGEGCPDASKIGEVQIATPLLKEEARGSLFVAKPFDNPFGSLIALYMVARIPERGVLIKQAGKVALDPKTGQIVTTFDDLPQLPFSTFKLHFREGGRAPLVTPPSCGNYEIVARFTPWSAADPANPLPSDVVTRTSSFTTERGVDGGACPGGGLPPFHPGLIAGSVNNAGGAYSPFNVRLFRSDGEQEMTNFSIKLPPGVIGKLAGVPTCSDAAIAAARDRTGAEELANPSCPAASGIGRTLVGAGVGSVLTYVPGKVYLAGPYHGAPLSIAAVTAAKVGPFDLGTVVVREAIRINPETAEVFIDPTGSDPLPHIIDGVTTHIRDIRAYIDRPEFMLNPTSCDPSSTASTVLGSGVDFASPADDRPVTVSTPYQAASCSALGFKPKLSLRLKGGTKRTGHPSLRAVFTTRKGDANVARAAVTLPKTELLDQAHIRTVCTRVQFAAGAGGGSQCPAGAVYGHARAISPLLDEPLEGPVFLRSSSHQLPDLVAALHSPRVDFYLAGRIDSVEGRIRNTFESPPDAPVSKFVLIMQGGKKGLLVNSTDICKAKPRATVLLDAQNGKTHDINPRVTASCGKGQKRKRAPHRGSR